MAGLFDVFSSDPADEAARAKTQGLEAARDYAGTMIDNGVSNANTYYGQALAPFSQLFAQGQQGYGAYSDATGVNGAEGLTRAGDLFKATPGYNEGINMSLDQNDRRAASRGQLGGGNTIADTTKLATDYASQKYGDYVSRLAPYLGAAQGAAAGQAGVLTTQAGTNYGAGAAKAGYGFNAGSGIANANSDAALADYGASGNFWGALMSAGNLAAKFAGAGAKK